MLPSLLLFISYYSTYWIGIRNGSMNSWWHDLKIINLKKLMGVFKDFSVCLKNKKNNINKTDKWKEGDPDIHVKS